MNAIADYTLPGIRRGVEKWCEWLNAIGCVDDMTPVLVDKHGCIDEMSHQQAVCVGAALAHMDGICPILCSRSSPNPKGLKRRRQTFDSRTPWHDFVKQMAGVFGSSQFVLVMRRACIVAPDQETLCKAAIAAVAKVLQVCEIAARTIAKTSHKHILFGSRSTGLAEESSDVDLEVQVCTPSAHNEKARHAMAVAWMQLVYARMLLCGTDGDFENVKLQSHKSTINLTFRHQTTCVDVDVCFTPVVELGLSDHSSMRDLLNASLSSASWDLRRTIKHLIQRAREAGMVQRHGEPRGTELKSVVIAALCCASTTLICS